MEVRHDHPLREDVVTVAPAGSGNTEKGPGRLVDRTPSGEAMPITSTGDRLFERFYLHNLERLSEKRLRTTHLGYVRLGMLPY